MDLNVGDPIINEDGHETSTFFGGPSPTGVCVLKLSNGEFNFTHIDYMEKHYKIPPLCWVDNGAGGLDPVYKGDTVYDGNRVMVAQTVYRDDLLICACKGEYNRSCLISECTTKKPKIKHVGWVLILNHYGSRQTTTFVYSTEQVANEVASRSGDNVIGVSKIEWEE